MHELIQIIIEEKASLFVCAIGIPPKDVVDKLHKAGIPVMNMVGHPKHVARALEAGVDLICAQGGEGGGHTGDVPSSVLVPACVDAVKGHKSSITGKPVYVVGAGAVFDGRSLAANLMWGAQAVCAHTVSIFVHQVLTDVLRSGVGTRFVASIEAGTPKIHKELVLSCGFDDAIRTVVYSGRPMHVRRTSYIENWYV